MHVKDYEKLLRSKFHFVLERQGNHIFYILELDELKPVRTFVGRHAGEDISSDRESDYAHELYVSRKQFRMMFSCTMSCDEYYDSLRNNTALNS